MKRSAVMISFPQKSWYLFGLLGMFWSLLGTGTVKAASETTPEKRWERVLPVLNEAPVPFPTFYSQSLNEDLLALNQSEMSGIAKSQPDTSRLNSKAEKREATNRYFHEQVTRLNAQTLRALEALNAPSHTVDYSAAANAVLKAAKQNPVTNLANTQARERGNEIGFCFGRALLVHYLLLKAGVPQHELAKVFTIGQLMVEGQLWRFHVGVLVRDFKHGFLVVDPLQERVLPYKEWIEINKNYDVKGSLSRARFYVTDPRKFLASYGAYHPAQLQDPALKEYFAALVRTL